jgi:hypothetical protein
MTLHIHAPPGHWHVTKQRRTRWCFECRKRTTYELRLWMAESGWYEPLPVWKCVECDQEADRFPGRE